MIDTGEYQNDIVSLSELNIKDYERIFKIFKLSEEDKEFYTYNILHKIEFPELDSIFLDFYTPPSDTPWSILSYNIYGDIKSWWILYLLNKDKFDGMPFLVSGGTEIKHIKDEFRSQIYQDITNSTVFGGRHY